MIAYLLNFTWCSALLLLAYHLLLKNKALFQFNRVYLLLSLLLSLTIPLIVVHHEVVPVPSFVPAQLVVAGNAGPVSESPVIAAAITPKKINYYNYAIAGVYGLVSLLLMLRFFKNLFIIIRTARRRENIYHNGAWLVLTDEPLVPHTFLSYIFLNQQDYHNSRIERDVINHEMAHARQYHSVDVIFIELIQAFCWFNPFIFLYRRAIQLNHEFIADGVAIHHSANAYTYKTLLLSMASQQGSLSITSQFNYSITKKRLIMMTKQTSTIAAWMSRAAMIPVMAAAFVLFCGKTEAQQPAAVKTDAVVKPEKSVQLRKVRFPAPRIFGGRPYPSTETGISASEIDDYISYEKKYVTDNKGHVIRLSDDEKKHLAQLFQRMSRKQQADRQISFTYPMEPIGKSYVTRAQLDKYTDARLYGVWIDDKRVKNEILKDVSPNDFCVASFSRLMPIAIKNDHFHYQVNLMTNSFYRKYLEEANANRNNSMMMIRKSRG